MRANKNFSFLSIPEVGEKQFAEEERKKNVSENNGQLLFHGSHLEQKSVKITTCLAPTEAAWSNNT